MAESVVMPLERRVRLKEQEVDGPPRRRPEPDELIPSGSTAEGSSKRKQAQPTCFRRDSGEADDVHGGEAAIALVRAETRRQALDAAEEEIEVEVGEDDPFAAVGVNYGSLTTSPMHEGVPLPSSANDGRAKEDADGEQVAREQGQGASTDAGATTASGVVSAENIVPVRQEVEVQAAAAKETAVLAAPAAVATESQQTATGTSGAGVTTASLAVSAENIVPAWQAVEVQAAAAKETAVLAVPTAVATETQQTATVTSGATVTAATERVEDEAVAASAASAASARTSGTEAPARHEVGGAGATVARGELGSPVSTDQPSGVDTGSMPDDSEGSKCSGDSDEDGSPNKGEQHGSNTATPPASVVQLTRGFVFSEEADPDDTWTKIWNDVRAALAERGHKGATLIKKAKRIRGGSSRWQRQELHCHCAGRPSAAADYNRQRKSRSAKCNCPFAVCVSWNLVDPPTMQKVNLEHNQDCTAQATAEENEAGNLVSKDVLYRDYESDIYQWTASCMPKSEMFQLLDERLKPLKLGLSGQQKVRYMSAKIERELWGSPTDARDFVCSLQAEPGCTVDVDTDSVGRLRLVMWSTAEQVVLARRFGDVVTLDSTFLTTRYGMNLCLFIGVDSENRTAILAQGFLPNVDTENKTATVAQGFFANERADPFEFALKHLVKACGGQPKVIITDDHPAVASAVNHILPNTKHLHCLWHVFEDIEELCRGSLKPVLLRLVKTAALAPSEDTFGDVWAEIKEVVKGTKCEGYFTGLLFDQRAHWARCYHPTTMTLNMTSSSRAEGILGVIEQGRLVNNRVSLVHVKKELDKWIADLPLASGLLRTKWTAIGRGAAEDASLKDGDVFLTELERVGASNYAKLEMVAAMEASPAYSTSVLAEGRESLRYLTELAQRQDDHESTCCEAPILDAFGGAADTDLTTRGVAPLVSFSKLLEKVPIDAVVKVSFEDKDSRVGHVVAVGPNGFQLCTCLQVLRCGLPCRHTLAALIKGLDRLADFTAASIHPRWRSAAVDEWNIASAGIDDIGGMNVD